MSKAGKTVKTISAVTVILLISKLIGFARELFLSYYYGTSILSDQFIVGTAAAGTFIGWLSTFSVVHTAVYQEVRHKGGKQKANRYTNGLVFYLIVIGLVCSVILSVFAPQIVKISAAGFDADALSAATVFFRYSLVGLVLYAVNKTYVSELNCENRIILASATDLIYSSVLVVFIVLAGQFDNYYLLRYSYLVAAGLQLVALLIALSVNKHQFTVSAKYDSSIKQSMVLVRTSMLSTMIGEINGYIDKIFGSLLTAGNVTALGYGEMISFMIYNIIANPIGTYIYPKLSLMIHTDQKERMTHIVRTIFQYFSLICIPISIFICLYSTDIIRILFYRGKFDDTSLLLTSETLTMYILYILPMSFRQFYTLIFNSYQMPKYNMYAGFFSLFGNIILNSLLYKPLGAMGIALSTTLTVIMTDMIYQHYFHTQIDQGKIVPVKLMAKYLLFSLMASVITVLLNKVLISYVMNSIIIILILLVVYVFIYAALVIFNDHSILSTARKIFGKDN